MYLLNISMLTSSGTCLCGSEGFFFFFNVIYNVYPAGLKKCTIKTLGLNSVPFKFRKF